MTKTYLLGSAKCMMCGKKTPSSACFVHDEKGNIIGSVCGMHTLAEGILTRKGKKRFWFELKLIKDE